MTKSELFEIMDKITADYVTSYSSDLEYDKIEITEHENDSTFEGIWLVRDCGTFLPRLSNALDQTDFVEGIYNNMRVLKQYYITKSTAYGWSIDEIDRKTLNGIIETPTQNAFIFKFSHGDTWDYMKTMTGHFESLDKAREVAEEIKTRKGYAMAYVDRA